MVRRKDWFERKGEPAQQRASPFARLGTRLGAFHLFMLGAVAFGMLAVLDWVALLLFAAWRSPAVATRRWLGRRRSASARPAD